MDTSTRYRIPEGLDHPAGITLELRPADDGLAWWLANHAGDYVRSPTLRGWPAALDELDTALRWLRDTMGCPCAGIHIDVPDHPADWHTDCARLMARYFPESVKPWERMPGARM